VVEGKPTTGNLLANGGFEGGLAPWYIPGGPAWEPGVVSSAAARSGKTSLHCALRAPAGERQQKRWGAMFAVGAVPFPRHVSLFYRADRWVAGSALQYVLFAVLIGAGDVSYQIRYFLCGPSAIPYNEQGNVRFFLVAKGPPALGTWTRFSTDLHRDFTERWGRVPHNFETLQVAVEARYEPLSGPLDRSIAADVYFDDVYVGYGTPPG
jgi:hypothetical protein